MAIPRTRHLYNFRSTSSAERSGGRFDLFLDDRDEPLRIARLAEDGVGLLDGFAGVRPRDDHDRDPSQIRTGGQLAQDRFATQPRQVEIEDDQVWPFEIDQAKGAHAIAG